MMLETSNERKSNELIIWHTGGLTWPVKCTGTTGWRSGISGHEYKVLSLSKFMFVSSHSWHSENRCRISEVRDLKM